MSSPDPSRPGQPVSGQGVVPPGATPARPVQVQGGQPLPGYPQPGMPPAGASPYGAPPAFQGPPSFQAPPNFQQQPQAYGQPVQYPPPAFGVPAPGGYPGQAPMPPGMNAPPPAFGQPMPAMPFGAVAPAAPAPQVPLSARPVPVQAPVAPMPAAVPAMPRPVVAAPVAAPAQSRPVPAAAGAAPRPVAVRPVPVSPGGVPVVSAAPANSEEEVELTEKAVKAAPPWLVSLIVHMVLLVIFGLITFSIQQDEYIYIESDPVYAEKLGDQVLDDKLQSPEFADMNITDPALSIDVNPANDPLAAPPMLTTTSLDANRSISDEAAPSVGLALKGREAGSKRALLAAYGGTATTESAVVLGLEWLKKNQLKDGSWSLAGPYEDGISNTDNKISATAMALLAFQGYGVTHKDKQTPDHMKFRDCVKKGWAWLLKRQDADGFFNLDAPYNQRLYAQAQATIAICEIYGMTKDPEFKGPAQKALDFAHRAQAPEGGWRYEPRVDSDTSVTGWFVMALQSGLMAGLEVKSPNLERISEFLDAVGREDQTRYAYRINEEAHKLTLTAEALLCRQYLGWKHKDPRLKNGIDYLLENPVDYSNQNVYYWYYATQALHHMDGPEWTRWNNVMKQAIPTNQTKTGPDAGSWSPSGDDWGPQGGRLYVTCLSIYMLEVYYRHLPIYKYRLE